MKVYSINGYWGDDQQPINGYKVAELDAIPEGYSDDDIFFYGLSENEIKQCINSGESVHDFVITSYELYDDTNRAGIKQ